MAKLRVIQSADVKQTAGPIAQTKNHSSPEIRR